MTLTSSRADFVFLSYTAYVCCSMALVCFGPARFSLFLNGTCCTYFVLYVFLYWRSYPMCELDAGIVMLLLFLLMHTEGGVRTLLPLFCPECSYDVFSTQAPQETLAFRF